MGYSGRTMIIGGFKLYFIIHILLNSCNDFEIFIIVGIGGTYDCTNIIRNPVVCGITTLDIDHTAILGKTVEEIAWHKAGIMKSGSIAFVDGDISQVKMQYKMS